MRDSAQVVRQMGAESPAGPKGLISGGMDKPAPPSPAKDAPGGGSATVCA